MITKILIKRIGVLALTILLINSCEKFIDVNPRDKISVDDYWYQSSHLENYIKRFYNYLPTSFPFREGDSDDVIFINESSILNGVRSPRTGKWTSEWSNIRDINIFFDNYQKCEDSYLNYKQYLGEAYFFRAWFYFDLLDTYGDVPWYAKAIQIDDEEALMRPRDPRTFVSDKILADLDEAITHLGYRSETGNSRINKEAALAFKTRVALFEGTWQKYHAKLNTPFATANTDPNKYFQACISAAEELINNSDYEVGLYNTGNPNQDYFKLFGFTNMSNIDEVLLYRAYNAADGLYNTIQSTITYKPSGIALTWDLISSYLGIDGKPYNFLGLASTIKGNAFLTQIANECDPRLRSTVMIPGDVISSKLNVIYNKPPIDRGTEFICPTGFGPKKGLNPDDPGAGLSWEAHNGETGLIIFRYGEVLLNYAEAKCELDNTVAFEQLNLLRDRVGMPDFEVNPKSSYFSYNDYGYSITDELYAIRQERRVELAVEAFREDDYRRWAAHSLFKGKRPKGYPFSSVEFPNYNPPLDADQLIDYYANRVPNGYQFREGQDYLTSIPQDELVLNPNLVQNPGW
jgi:hypothetical protein